MAKMGGMNWEGLFASQGNTLDDVRAKIGQEREAKVRQAYADAISGGGSLNAARVARAAEQQKQLMMGAVQNLFGSKDGIIKQDPRLARASKRDQDRQEMMDMFSTAQSDGEITIEEKNAIVDEMLKRGYLGEAEKFTSIWNSRRKLDIDEIGNKAALQKARNAAKTGTDLKSSQVQDAFEDANGVRYRSVLYNFKNGSSQTFIINDAGDIVPRSQIAGDPSKWKPVDTTGMSSWGRIYETGKKEGAKLGAKQADKWVDVRQSMIDAGNAAKSEFKDLIRAYQLASKTKTGGLQETVLAVRQYLGVDSGDIGELASLFRTGVISRLKEMGSKPTDKDLEYLESAVQSLGNDRETNQRILKRMVGRVNQIIARGEYLKKNPDMSREDFNRNDYKSRTYDWRSEADPPIVTQLPPVGQRNIGDVVRTNRGTFRWNGQNWEGIE